MVRTVELSAIKIVFKSGSLQQRQQTTLRVQGHQIVTTAHMGVAHINLRDRASPCGLHHVVALNRIQVNADFFNLLHAVFQVMKKA